MRRPANASWLSPLLPIIVLALSYAPAWSQVPTDPEPTQLDEIVVQGSLSGIPLREQVETFVDTVTDPPLGRGPARWYERAGVCVGAADLRRDAAQAMVDRVSEVAVTLGLPVGEPGCSPNVVVIATDDASTLARALVQRSPNAFRPDYAGAAGSVQQLELFITTDRPVRWWHVAMLVTADSGSPAIRLPGDPVPRFIRGEGLLNTAIRNELRRAFVIIDINQVDHLTLGSSAIMSPWSPSSRLIRMRRSETFQPY